MLVHNQRTKEEHRNRRTKQRNKNAKERKSRHFCCSLKQEMTDTTRLVILSNGGGERSRKWCSVSLRCSGSSSSSWATQLRRDLTREISVRTATVHSFICMSVCNKAIQVGEQPERDSIDYIIHSNDPSLFFSRGKLKQANMSHKYITKRKQSIFIKSFCPPSGFLLVLLSRVNVSLCHKVFAFPCLSLYNSCPIY